MKRGPFAGWKCEESPVEPLQWRSNGANQQVLVRDRTLLESDRKSMQNWREACLIQVLSASPRDRGPSDAKQEI